MANSRSLKAGKAFIEFSLKDGKVRSQLRNLQKRFAAVGSGLQRLGGLGLKVGGALAGSFGAALTVFAKVGDELNKMSARTGFSAQTLSELSFAAEQSGTDLQAVEKGIRGMQRSLLDAERGLSTATDNLDDLGVSLGDIKGLSPEQQFEVLTEAISRVQDPSRRAAIAMKLFGRAGSSLLPLLNGGASGMAALREEARDLGITLSDKDAQSAADFTDALSRMWKQLKRVAIGVGIAVAGPLTEFMHLTKGILKNTIDWMGENTSLIRGVAIAAAVTGTLGAVVFSTGIAFSLASVAVGGIVTAIGVVASVFGAILSPIGLVVAAIGGIGVAFAKFTTMGIGLTGVIGEAFGRLRDFVIDVFGSIAAALSAGNVEAASNVMWAGLKVIWLQGVNYITSLWGSAVVGVIDLWGRLRKTWVEVVGGLKDAWTAFTSFVRTGWAAAQASITRNVLKLQKKIMEAVTGESFDISNELRVADETEKKQKAQIQAEKNAALGASNRQTQSSTDEINALMGDIKKSLGGGSTAELDKAMADLEVAITEANTLKGEGISLGGLGEQVKTAIGSLSGSGGAASIVEKTSGTYSSLQAALGGAGLEKQQLKVLKEIRDKFDNGGGIPAV